MNNNPIAVICPSRDRPDRALDAYNSWLETKSCSDFYIVCDSDQEELYNGPYNKIVSPRTGRRGMCDPTNYAAKELMNSYAYIYWMGDDHVFRTKEWDQKVLDAYADMGGNGFVYGNDLLQGPNLPTACAMSCNYIQKLGYMVYPALIHLYIDNYWMSLGKSLNKLTYLPDVIIEHMHFCNGKAQHDAAYAAVNNGPVINADQATYHSINFNQEVSKLV